MSGDLLALAQNGGSSGGSGGGHDAVATQMILANVNTASVEGAWKMADRNNAFAALINSLEGVEIAGKTAAAAFDDATDALAVAQSASFIDRLNASTYLTSVANASAEMAAFAGNFAPDPATLADQNANSGLLWSNAGYGGVFNDDGTKYFTCNRGTDTIHEWYMDPAYDATSITHVRSASVGASTGPIDLSFKGDGTKVYVACNDSDEIKEFDLATAWDFTSVTLANTFSFAQTGVPGACCVVDDQLYVVAYAVKIVHRFSLATAWSLASATHQESFDASADLTGDASFIAVASNGQRMILGSSGDDLVDYPVPTPHSLSSITGRASRTVISESGSFQGFAFTGDSLKAFINMGGTVHEYLGTSYLKSGYEVQP